MTDKSVPAKKLKSDGKVFLVKEETIDKTSNRFWQIDRQKGNPIELTPSELELLKIAVSVWINHIQEVAPIVTFDIPNGEKKDKLVEAYKGMIGLLKKLSD